jgi:type IV secretory pathway VirB2 component (pilin)
MSDEFPKSGDEPSGLYEPLEPPYQNLTATNRGPIAFTAATTLIAITGLTTAIKLWTMYATTRRLGLNDGCMILALVRHILASAISHQSLMSHSRTASVTRY